MKKIIVLIVLAFALMSCTKEDSARKALLDAGYKPIEVGGYGWLQGGEDDIYVTKFKAYSPGDSTRVVTGVVCEGLFMKSKTIRLD